MAHCLFRARMYGLAHPCLREMCWLRGFMTIRRGAIRRCNHFLVEVVIACLLLFSNLAPFLNCLDFAFTFACFLVSHLVNRGRIAASNLTLLLSGELVTTYQMMPLFKDRSTGFFSHVLCCN